MEKENASETYTHALLCTVQFSCYSLKFSISLLLFPAKAPLPNLQFLILFHSVIAVAVVRKDAITCLLLPLPSSGILSAI